MHRSSLLVWFAPLALVAVGCRGGGGGTGGEGGGGGEGQGGISDATSLACPFPGQLPFVLESTGFQTEDAAGTAEGSPRSKDEAADTFGVAMGASVTTYAAAGTAPTPGSKALRGRKARTGVNSGLTAIGLGGENVSLWYYDDGKQAWETLGRSTTDGEGYYEIAPPTGFAAALGAPVYAVLEADKSCAAHYEVALPSETKFVLTDIDGTMTLSDEELFKQIDNGTYDPLENASASAMMNTWHDKGYEIVYLTARPHNFRAETRAWLDAHGFPTGGVISANTLVFDQSARDYKSAWVKRLLGDYGWNVVAAYGNAESDIQAYEDAGIPKDITFIVGPFAGASGTQGIADNDYGNHLSDFVEPYPANN
jgi:hypothetical protein